MNYIRARKIVRASVLVVLSLSATVASGLELDDAFNSIGAYGNVTGPQAYQSQTMNGVTGGSIFMRVPNRNYALANFTPPRFGGSCSTIDLYAGSFSYINEAQLTAMMTNVGSSALSYAWSLALKSLCPQCEGVINNLNDLATKINGRTINSCEAAKALLGPESDNLQDAREYISRQWARLNNTSPDGHKAGEDSQNPATAKMNEDQCAADPSCKDKLVDGNIVWRALEKLGGFTEEEKELFMSLTGTIVIDTDTNAVQPEPRYLPPTIEKKNALVTFVVPDATALAPNATIDVYDCPDLVADPKCLNPVITPRNYGVSFMQQVKTRLERMRQNIMVGAPQDAVDVAFVGNTSLPVYKMLSVSASMGSQMLLHYYSELIAIEYAEYYLQEIYKILIIAIRQQKSKSTQPMVSKLERFEKNLLDAQITIAEEKREKYQAAIRTTQMAETLRHMERRLLGNMPDNLRDSMALAGGL